MTTRTSKSILTMLKEIYFNHQEVINYVFFGGLTTMVSLVIKYALLYTILDAKDAIQLQTAVIVSWVGAVTFAFFTNRRFVFKSKSAHILKEITLFYGPRLSTLGIESVLMWLFVTLLGFNTDMQVAIWTLVVQALVIIANYFLSKKIVFRKS